MLGRPASTEAEQGSFDSSPRPSSTRHCPMGQAGGRSLTWESRGNTVAKRYENIGVIMKKQRSESLSVPARVFMGMWARV